MRVVVFCGPTISAAEVREKIDAICLPPAKHGDILRAVEMSPKPRVIAIIDGSFRTVPAVRHKEILWALHQGVHVFGAASMGALRAAELCALGMVGIGSIFADYHSGLIEDDDEVAVEHGPAGLGFLPLSEAMVDIRATLEAALHDGVIGQKTKDHLNDMAKQLFYADRRWSDLISRSRISELDSTELDALEVWLPTGRVSRKHSDALEMLAVIRDFIAIDPSAFEARFTFERTEVWDLDYEAAHGLPQVIGSGTDALLVQDILDELRLVPTDYTRVLREALNRLLSIREARRRRNGAEPDEKEKVLRAWLRECGMGLEEALEQSRISREELDTFLEEEVLVRWTAAAFGDVAQNQLIGTLRSHGWLARLIERAEAKQRALRDMGKEATTTQTGNISPAALVGWFWRLAYPGQIQTMSSEALAQRMGFADVSDMSKALLREYLFREHCEKQGISTRTHGLTEG
ncbi:TfuA-like protein [Microvirga sp. G4-2]|uniref:TfuA-like protein n=1 Tax=Microvirga sp. G4-2 TaxID=3434467 RepID=UPI00404475DB